MEGPKPLERKKRGFLTQCTDKYNVLNVVGGIITAEFMLYQTRQALNQLVRFQDTADSHKRINIDNPNVIHHAVQQRNGWC